MAKLLNLIENGSRWIFLPMNEEHWPAMDLSKPPYSPPSRWTCAVAMRSGEWVDPKLMPPRVQYPRKIDQEGKTIEGQCPLLDVMVARNNSAHTLVVSDRFKRLLERFDPLAAQFFEVGFQSYTSVPVVDCISPWWIMNFLKFHDSIDEARSNRHWIGDPAPPGSAGREPVLVAAPDIPEENAFWCGMEVAVGKQFENPALGVIYRAPPLNLGRARDTYCSDAFYDAAMAEGLDICDSAWTLEPPGTPAAFGSPADISSRLRDLGESAYQLSIPSVIYFGESEVDPDDVAATKRLYRAARLVERGETLEDWHPPTLSMNQRTVEYQHGVPSIFQRGMYGLFLSEAIRDAVEAMEPGVHRYVPLDVVDHGGPKPVRHRYFNFICGNVVDSVIRAASPDAMKEQGEQVVLDASIVANLHVWTSKKFRLNYGAETLVVSADAFRNFAKADPHYTSFKRRLRVAEIERN